MTEVGVEPGVGVDLRRLPALLAAAVGPHLRVRLLADTDSTNDDARSASLDRGGAALLVADSQRQGRGRSGAAWFSPAGTGIHLSLTTRLDLPAPLWPRASLVVGLATARALRRHLGADVRCKWPNDLMVRVDGGWRKLGGVLCERVDDRALGPRWIAGVGLNHSTPRSAFPAALRDHVASLSEVCAPLPQRSEIIAAVVGELDRAVADFVARRGALDVDGLGALLLFVGDRVQLDFGDPRSERWVRLVGLAASGALLVTELSAAPGSGPFEVQPLQITAACTTPPWRAAPLLPVAGRAVQRAPALTPSDPDPTGPDAAP